jgi:hypothetical protein
VLSSIWKGILLAAGNVFLVALLIVVADSSEFRGAALIPILATACVLERLTRPVPPLPMARALA